MAGSKAAVKPRATCGRATCGRAKYEVHQGLGVLIFAMANRWVLR